jgi:hypothetical protein
MTSKSLLIPGEMIHVAGAEQVGERGRPICHSAARVSKQQFLKVWLSRYGGCGLTTIGDSAARSVTIGLLACAQK